MAANEETYYEALAHRLTDPEVPSQPPARVLTGATAAKYAHEFLLREFGSNEAIDAAMLPGRSRVGGS